MSSLKEIKNRIVSIQSTQKITSAMKQIASAKLHQAQSHTAHTLAYAQQLSELLGALMAATANSASPLTEERPVKCVAIVACASDTGLCGSFNATVWKRFAARIEAYQQQGVEVRLYPIGRKIVNELQKAGYTYDTESGLINIASTYEKVAAFAEQLISSFLRGEVDRVELLYHHFKSSASQPLMEQTFLPLTLPPAAETTGQTLLEPSAEELLALLLPRWLKFSLYSALLDAYTAEHAARMIAMQVASDNANELLRTLTHQYNKSRQQAITNELLDIVQG
ncbi:MAG: ATP synthase F1 subunit gamma [Parabacteroides sp.]